MVRFVCEMLRSLFLRLEFSFHLTSSEGVRCGVVRSAEKARKTCVHSVCARVIKFDVLFCNVSENVCIMRPSQYNRTIGTYKPESAHRTGCRCRCGCGSSG